MERALNTIYGLIIWACFIVGCLTHDAWIAAPAAFLILLETLEDR